MGWGEEKRGGELWHISHHRPLPPTPTNTWHEILHKVQECKLWKIKYVADIRGKLCRAWTLRMDISVVLLSAMRGTDRPNRSTRASCASLFRFRFMIVNLDTISISVSMYIYVYKLISPSTSTSRGVGKKKRNGRTYTPKTQPACLIFFGSQKKYPGFGVFR